MQRTDEWVNIDEQQLQYHVKQWDEPKQSTKAFAEFLSGVLSPGNNVIDLGAGTGAATAFIAGSNPDMRFTAADYVPEFVDIGNRIAAEKDLQNLDFKRVDIFNLDSTDEFDGVVSLQTLSWLPEAETPLTQILEKLQPEWLALTSLFYEGDITCTIEVNEHTRERKTFYNIYSLKEIDRICQRFGYSISTAEKFTIDIDLPKPEQIDLMGTYTVDTASTPDSAGERLQVSGPLLMPWYMVLIRKAP